MIVTLIAGFAAGALFDQAIPYIRKGASRAQISLPSETLRLVSFALCLAATALVLRLLVVEPRPVALLLAAAVGVARAPVMQRIRTLRR